VREWRGERRPDHILTDWLQMREPVGAGEVEGLGSELLNSLNEPSFTWSPSFRSLRSPLRLLQRRIAFLSSVFGAAPFFSKL
jgi:hypothetical protein